MLMEVVEKEGKGLKPGTDGFMSGSSGLILTARLKCLFMTNINTSAFTSRVFIL